MSPPRQIIVIGAGLVGLATARQLQQRGHHVVVIDKEPAVATHQSGRNSGVAHAGVYYPPGSRKARFCVAGRTALLALCAEAGIAHRVCGKVIVATRTDELGRLAALADRARRAGVSTELVDRAGVLAVEPHVDAVAGLVVPSTAVVDFPAVAAHLARQVTDSGGHLELGTEVRAIVERADGVTVETSQGERQAAAVVTCAGVHSARLAATSTPTLGVRIIAFRGEYWSLRPQRRHLVRALVYPVPDPALPFLGVHFTRDVHDAVHIGPNAVVALGAEAYRWRTSDPRALLRLAADPAARAMGRRWWRHGVAELGRSVAPPLLVRAAQRLVPEVTAGDLLRAPAGIRAQAVDDQGRLLDDFALVATQRCLHVLNAPSPAATACLAIAEDLADRLDALPALT
ncbi:MAG: L-2-hydroxyglutarate oxidase [Acidimicrobiia bacterium]|nr:L-2-hydroxyglutarate oxidase [Acidimicrobiia bacterium]